MKIVYFFITFLLKHNGFFAMDQANKAKEDFM